MESGVCCEDASVGESWLPYASSLGPSAFPAKAPRDDRRKRPGEPCPVRTRVCTTTDTALMLPPHVPLGLSVHSAESSVEQGVAVLHSLASLE